MKYAPPTGSANADAPYIGKNVAAGIQGSKVPPVAIEAPQREIQFVITQADLDPTNSDFTQLWQAIQRMIVTTTPQIATANVILYVDWQAASDANADGSVSNPFKTIAAAIRYGNQRYFFAGFGLTIQLVRQSVLGSPSSYYEPPVLIFTVPEVTILGDAAHQDNYIIAGSVPVGQGVVLAASGSVNLVGAVVLVQTANYHGCGSNGGKFGISNVTLANSLSGSTTYAAILAAANNVNIGQGCVIAGGYWGAVLSASSSGSNIGITSGTALTVSSACVLSSAFAVVYDCGTITTIGASINGAGVAGTVGSRFNATLNGVINTGGQGANFFPGNSAGGGGTGGQYV